MAGPVSAVAQAAADDAPEAVTQEQSASDEAIRGRLQAIFDRVEAMSGITAEVEAGIVRLTGTVAGSEAAARAEELARGQEGVVFVVDRLELTGSLEERLQPTWERLRELAYGTVAMLPLLAVALAIVVVAALFGWAAGRWGGPAFLRTRNPFLRSIIARAIQSALVLVGLLVALDLLDAGALVGAVVGTAGLAGLAIGFAFKDIVENYLAGLLLAFRQPFAPHDQVLVDGFEGKVVRLTPRETILMTLEGNHVRLPNALIFRSPLVNYTRNPRRRFQFDISVGPTDDLALVQETGIAVLRSMESVLDDPAPEALVVEVGDSWVTARFFGWVDQRRVEFTRARSEAVRLVKLGLEERGVSLPPPEYLIRMQGDGERVEAPAGATEPPVGGRAGATGVLREADVSVDRSVDRQIEEDREASGEEDLLERP